MQSNRACTGGAPSSSNIGSFEQLSVGEGRVLHLVRRFAEKVEHSVVVQVVSDSQRCWGAQEESLLPARQHQREGELAEWHCVDVTQSRPSAAAPQDGGTLAAVVRTAQPNSVLVVHAHEVLPRLEAFGQRFAQSLLAEPQMKVRLHAISASCKPVTDLLAQLLIVLIPIRISLTLWYHPVAQAVALCN